MTFTFSKEESKRFLYNISHYERKIGIFVMSMYIMINDHEGIRWLCENGHYLNSYIFLLGIQYGSLETIKLLKDIGCPWNRDILSIARQRKDGVIYDWLKNNVS